MMVSPLDDFLRCITDHSQRKDHATRCSGTPWSASGPTRETSDEWQNLLLLTQVREAEDGRG